MLFLRSSFPAAVIFSVSAGGAHAAISYASPGSTYSENFNSLPKDAPSNANIETAAYPNGWTDDTTTIAGNRVSVPGWYLYHPLVPGATPPAVPENGANDHQRLRFGPGANTGSFWSFGSSNTALDMALGSLGSATVAADNTSMFIAVRLTNDTGGILNAFTVRYDGEQWRDGQSATGETLVFEYSTTALAADWNTTAIYATVPALNFTSPVFAGTGTGGTAVDGNAAGLTAGITATVTGINWAPGTDLWLRWSDNSLPSLADDGLAVDNFTFSAVPEPSCAALCAAAAAFLTRRRRSSAP